MGRKPDLEGSRKSPCLAELLCSLSETAPRCTITFCGPEPWSEKAALPTPAFLH